MSKPASQKPREFRRACIGPAAPVQVDVPRLTGVVFGAIPAESRANQDLDTGLEQPQTDGATRCCTVSHAPGFLSEVAMPTNKRRIAVNLADEEYSDLADLARQHDVSMAWLGRQAILEFVEHHRAEQLALPMRFKLQRASRVSESGLNRGGRS